MVAPKLKTEHSSLAEEEEEEEKEPEEQLHSSWKNVEDEF